MQRFLARLWVEDRRVAERELPSVHMLRVLVEQKPEVGGRPMSRSDGQEHVLSGSGTVAFQYTETSRSAASRRNDLGAVACMIIPELG